MKSQFRILLSVNTVGLVLASFLLAASHAQAAGRNPNPGVVPPGSKAYGKTYSEWAAVWWQWTYSFPAGEDTNPVQDPTGALCHLGDMGPVHFLAGSFGQTTVRHCTVRTGQALFFPIINTLWINLPEFGDDPWSDEQQEFASGFIAPFVDNAFNLSCTVDGVAVGNLAGYRTQTSDTGEYMITLPENNLVGIPAGVYGPSVDDGIYLMVSPLRPGLHTIQFTAASQGSFAGDFALDVTYHLTVE